MNVYIIILFRRVVSAQSQLNDRRPPVFRKVPQVANLTRWKTSPYNASLRVDKGLYGAALVMPQLARLETSATVGPC